MQVITLEEEAFYVLLNKVIAEVKKQYSQQALSKWIDGEEAMNLLKISSKTTLQKLRDTGSIRFSQSEEMKKVILYDRDSITAYIEKHAKNTF